jgi:hypothetical protein
LRERELELFKKLLRENCNLADVSGTLKALKIPFSAGSWNDLFEKRLEPAIRDGKIGREQLLRLIRDGEEYGTQHIFLFGTAARNAASVINENYVRRELSRLDRMDLLENPPLLDQPKDLALADVRFEQRGQERCLIVKAIEQRTYERFVGQRDESASRFIREYERFTVRAVNVVRLHPNGLLEIRIYSHRNTSDYEADLSTMWDKINFLIPTRGFDPVSISKAKRYLWTKRASLKGIIRYTSSSLRDPSGDTVAASSAGGQQSLFNNPRAAASIDAFYGDDTMCDRSNIWWEKRDPAPSKDVHTLLGGAINEFALTAQCGRDDYEYVLEGILKANE